MSKSKLNVCTANLYELQDSFDEAMEILNVNLNVDNEVLANLAMSWVCGLIKEEKR